MDKKPPAHSSSQAKIRTLGISAAGVSDKGRVRDVNEDSFYLGQEDGIFIVSDGMGGHLSGEIASRIVVEIFPQILAQSLQNRLNVSIKNTPDRAPLILQAVTELNELISHKAQTELGLYGMGATIALVWVTGASGSVYLANVGDSRIYYYRNGKLNQLSRDHSIVAILLQQGEIKPEEARDHPARGRLYRYIGMDGEATAEIQRIHPQPGEMLLVCSDGLTDHLDDQRIQEFLSETPELPAACQALVDASNQAGGKDNITVMLIRWDEMEI